MISPQTPLKFWKEDWFQEFDVSPHGGHMCCSQSSQLRSAKNNFPRQLKSSQNLAAIQALSSDLVFSQISTKQHALNSSTATISTTVQNMPPAI